MIIMLTALKLLFKDLTPYKEFFWQCKSGFDMR